MKTIVFDLDGTLICSHEDVWNCLDMALQPFHKSIPPEIRKDHKILNRSAGEILKIVHAGATTLECEQYARDVHHFYLYECSFEQTYLYPGVYELIEQLHQRGNQLLIVTMKPEELARGVLRAKGIDHFFKGVFSPDSFPMNRLMKKEIFQMLLKRYDLHSRNCIAIGDQPADVEAAHAHGLPAIAVTWGYGEREAIVKSQPEAILSSVSELSEYFMEAS